MTNLSPINALALSIAGKQAAKSDRPDAGDYSVGFTVTFDDGESIRVAGPVRQGEDYEQAVWQSVPWQHIAAVLFSKANGVQWKPLCGRLWNWLLISSTRLTLLTLTTLTPKRAVPR